MKRYEKQHDDYRAIMVKALADRIVVVEGGRVTESGSHEQLLTTGGKYAEMFHLQASRFTS